MKQSCNLGHNRNRLILKKVQFFLKNCKITLYCRKIEKSSVMERESFNMEFIFRASPAILYKFLTTPSCLIRWFCDGVDIQDDVFVFDWQGYEEEAELLDDIEEERLRFRWLDAENESEYFEYRIYTSDVTGETILEITDFADEDEVQEQKDLWESQIEKLRKETGG